MSSSHDRGPSHAHDTPPPPRGSGPPRSHRRRGRRIAAVLAATTILLVVGLVVVALVMVPDWIARRIEAQIDARVRLDGWWIGPNGVGLTNLILEPLTPPVDAQDGDRIVAVDSIALQGRWGDLLAGRLSSTVLTLSGVKTTLRFDEEGHLLSPLPAFRESLDPQTDFTPPALIRLERADLTLIQGSRSEHFQPVALEATPGPRGWSLVGGLENERLGTWTLDGFINEDFSTIRLTARGRSIPLHRIYPTLPLAPPEIWDDFQPLSSLQSMLLEIVWDGSDGDAAGGENQGELSYRIEADLTESSWSFPRAAMTGRARDGGLLITPTTIELRSVTLDTLGGQLKVGGTLDLSRNPSPGTVRLSAINLDLQRVPDTWGLERFATSGRLSGEATVKLLWDDQGFDFTGSQGQAEIRNALIQNTPVRNLRVTLTAKDRQLTFDQGQTAPIASGEGWFLRLPETVQTQIKLDKVDLGRLARIAAGVGLDPGLAIQGRVSVEAKAVIPLRDLGDWTRYGLDGSIRLIEGQFDDLKLGPVTARVKLNDGLLELDDVVGTILDDHTQPNHTPHHTNIHINTDNNPRIKIDANTHAKANAATKDREPPRNGFHVAIRASLKPNGRATIDLATRETPLPPGFLPGFTGRVSMIGQGSAPMTSLSNPSAWQAALEIKDANVSPPSLLASWTRQPLNAAAKLRLDQGQLVLEQARVLWAGQPLNGSGELGLTAPYNFTLRLTLTDWDVPRLAAQLAPQLAARRPEGQISATVDLTGRLDPPLVTTQGRALATQARLEGRALGPVSVAWRPLERVVENANPGTPATIASENLDPARSLAIEAELLGASWSLTAGPIATASKPDGEAPPRLDPAAVPASSPSPRWWSLVGTFRNLDVSRVALMARGDPPPHAGVTSAPLAGIASGSFRLVTDGGLPKGRLRIVANPLQFDALTLRAVDLNAVLSSDSLRYELSGDTLQGRFELRGDLPFNAEEAALALDGPKTASIRASELALGELLAVTGQSEILRKLTGRVNVAANLHLDLQTLSVRTGTVAEARDLGWDGSPPLGWIRATARSSPDRWRLDPLVGQFAGGKLVGNGEGNQRADGVWMNRLDLTLNQGDLSQLMTAFVDPSWGNRVKGRVNLDVRSRSVGSTWTGNGFVEAPQTRIASFPLNNARIEFDWRFGLEMVPPPLQITARRFAGSLAGGSVVGDFDWRSSGLPQSQLLDLNARFTEMNLAVLARSLPELPGNASGVLNGTLKLKQANERLSGDLNAELRQAMLFELPVFSQISDRVGLNRVGVFERGRLTSRIVTNGLLVESLELQGPVVQMAVTGTVGFDRRLDLEVLVSNNQIVTELSRVLIPRLPVINRLAGEGVGVLDNIIGVLSEQLLKFRVTGTLDDPRVTPDPTIRVTPRAARFFSELLNLPRNLIPLP